MSQANVDSEKEETTKYTELITRVLHKKHISVHGDQPRAIDAQVLALGCSGAESVAVKLEGADGASASTSIFCSGKKFKGIGGVWVGAGAGVAA